ncbi:uncharacterized protein PG986_013325 [Apiospora aurea]|uniref:Zinc finger PHD-type domain-containing protein n=1 Tax=Apiospora aurea TaxID=335848 RepID=A0ABR1PV88_9PEZI
MAPTTSTTKPSARTSTRFSSPLQLASSPSGHNKGVSTEGQRSFMRHWLEPPVEQKPSFAQQGLMRGGVLEGMAPLGTLPKAAMLKKPSVSAEGTPAPTVKRIVLKKSTKAATPVEETSAMPQMSAAMAAPDAEMALDSLEPSRSSPTQPIFPATGLDDSDDGDYRPNASRTRRSSIHSHHNRKLTKRHSRPGRKSSARAASPAPSVHPEPDIPEPTPAVVEFQPPPALLGRPPIDKAFADKVVEAAVDEALHHYRYPTAWALRTLYDELGDKEPCFVHMIEDIFHQRADIDTIKEFNKLVRDSKTRGKRDNEACNYFIPPDNRTTPHKPKPAPYHDLLQMDFTPVKQTSQDMDGHINKKAKLELDEPLAAGRVRSSSSGSGNDSHNRRGSHSGSHSGSANGGNVGNGSSSRGRSGSSSRPVSKLNLNGASGLNGAPAPARVNGFTTINQNQNQNPSQSQSQSQKQSPAKRSSSKQSPSKGKKHRRSSSVSSDSSLSEVPDDEPEDYEEFQKRLEDEISRPSTAEPNHAPKPGDLDQPISDEKTKPTSKKAPKPDGSRNTSTHPFHPHDSDMAAAAVITNGASHQHSHRASTPLKFPSKYGDVGIQDQLTLRKHEAKADTRGVTEDVVLPSFTRKPLDEDLSAVDNALAQAPTEQPRALRTPAANLRATRASRRNNEDAESSPIAPEMDIPSTRGSRAATPSNNLRSTKKQKTGLRVKTSPMKRKGTAAGVPREAPVNSGPSFNDKFTGNRGTFGSLLDNLDKTNSRAFGLPQDIRDYFENVRTGPDGEYEELPAGKPVKVNKKGYDEPFDFYKVRDADGRPVLCHQCLKGASDNRAIIPCSAPNCGLQFHLECLDPL